MVDFSVHLAQLDPSGIIEAAGQSAEATAASFNELTESVLNSALYAAIARIGSGFAAAFVVVWIVLFLRSSLQSNALPPLENLLVPMVLVMLLSGGGALLRDFSLSARNLINSTNQFVLEYTATGVNLAEAYGEANRNQAIDVALGEIIRQCTTGDLSPEQQVECMEQQTRELENTEGFDLPDDAQDRIDQAQELVEEGGGNFAEQIAAGILANIGSQVEILMRHLLQAMSMAYQWVMELTLLLIFLVGPIALGASLLPAGSKPIFAWFGGIIGAAMAKLSFNVVVGLAAMVAVDVEANDPMIFLLVIGIMAPILATVVASFGGASIYGSLASAAGSAFGAAAGGVGAAGRSVARAAPSIRVRDLAKKFKK